MCQEVRAGLEAEEASFRRARVEFRDHTGRVREHARARHELKAAVAKLQRARTDQHSADAVVSASVAAKVNSLGRLGR